MFEFFISGQAVVVFLIIFNSVLFQILPDVFTSTKPSQLSMCTFTFSNVTSKSHTSNN